MTNHQRDLLGYGDKPPRVVWPGNALIAINFVLNYEEGSERNIDDGDESSEDYLVDLPGVSSLYHQRHFSSESMFEYGSRVGVWRLLKLFADYEIPITVFATGVALKKNLPLAATLAKSDHEIAGHGYRWISYRDMAIEKEREEIRLTLNTIQTLTNKKIYGWYTGRRSENTRHLIVEQNLLYDSDSYNDDLPYWVRVENKNHLVIPYTMDTNDARYAITPGYNNAQAFYNQLKFNFDYLLREGHSSPKLMTVALHARLSGRPSRAEAIRLFIEYILKYETVWICKREDIAKHWLHHHSINKR